MTIEEDKEKALGLAIAALEKEHGKGTIMKLNGGAIPGLSRVHSGSMALDRAIGGGYPRGRIIEIYGPASSGKAQPLTVKIATPNGWTTMGELSVGQRICTPDGKDVPVLGIFPQGEKDIFKISFSDGTFTECCLEHFWTVQTQDDKRQNIFRTLSTQQLLEDYKLQDRYKYMIPMTSAVHFNEQVVSLDPYILGLLLGDGGLTGSTTEFTTVDQEIVNSFNHYAESTDQIVRLKDRITYVIKKKTSGHEKSPITKELINLGLAKKSSPEKYIPEKYIPEKYIFNSIENRVSLLQGLMDSDGTVSRDKNGGLSYCSTSKQLAKDVVELVQSLGGRATVSEKKTHYTYKEEYRTGRLAYNINITLPLCIKPFRLNRKAALYTSRIKDTLTRFIVDIQPIGRKEAQCIYIDHPDHLYLTDSFIVTHNTTLTLHAIAETQKAGGRAAFIDVEHAFDFNYAKALGVDINNLIFAQPMSAEEALDIVEKLVDSGAIDIIVIDSVAALVPQKEVEATMGDMPPMAHAKLMSQAMRKLSPKVGKANCIAIFINQIRMKMVMMGNPETTTGGQALAFFASMRLDVRARGKVQSGTGENKEFIANEVEVKVVKNKTAPPFRVAEIQISYGKGMEMTYDLLKVAVDLGVIQRAGAWYSYKDNKIGQGEEKTATFLDENPEVRKVVFQEVKAAMSQ